jgi:hypothetical protein
LTPVIWLFRLLICEPVTETGFVNIGQVYTKLSLIVIFPRVVGQLVQRCVHPVRDFYFAHKKVMKKTAEWALVFIIFTIFSRNFYSGSRAASFTAPRSNLSYRWDEDRSALVVRAKTRLAGGDALVITYGAQGNAAHTGSVSSRTSSPTGPAMMCISCWWTSTHSETLRRTFAHFAFEDHSTMRWASGVYSCRKLLKIGPTFKRGGWFIRLPPKSPSNDATAPVTTRQPQYRD